MKVLNGSDVKHLLVLYYRHFDFAKIASSYAM